MKSIPRCGTAFSIDICAMVVVFEVGFTLRLSVYRAVQISGLDIVAINGGMDFISAGSCGVKVRMPASVGSAAGKVSKVSVIFLIRP